MVVYVVSDVDIVWFEDNFVDLYVVLIESVFDEVLWFDFDFYMWIIYLVGNVVIEFILCSSVDIMKESQCMLFYWCELLLLMWYEYCVIVDVLIVCDVVVVGIVIEMYIVNVVQCVGIFFLMFGV